MIEVELSRIIINERSDQQVIVLQEKNGNRAFPILIGTYEIGRWGFCAFLVEPQERARRRKGPKRIA